MGTTTPAPQPMTAPRAEPVPLAFLGRTSTLVLQDPVASMRRQLREVQDKLPPGWFIAAHYWDIESGGMDLDQRGHGTAHELVDVGIPRDGGMADLLAEAAGPAPRFAAVMCEDIERSGRDTFNALKLERQLADAGIPLFATDEPIDIGGMNATTLLVRRVKQGIAEWYRFQIREKAWKGLREHSLAGWNIGPAPYGYLAEKVPHPVAFRAAQGRTKSRLIIDPQRAPVVAQIFAWRVEDKLGLPAITARLNADTGACTPAKGPGWNITTVSAILANPKYTGHMVFGRRRTTAGRARFTPPGEWLWSPEPAHPAIVTRAVWDAAQAAGAAHGTARDGDELSAHPAARRTYILRSRLRCRICRRRMCGITRTSSRDARIAGALHTYYLCTHDPANPRHAAAAPDHPRTVSVREDALTEVIRQFYAERIFGPERAALLATQIPADAAAHAARREDKTTALQQRLRQIDTAENAHAREIEELATAAAPEKAITALRTRILARFTELEEERATINDQLATLAKTSQDDPSPELLDALPLLGDILAGAPKRLQAALYDAFSIELLYNTDMHQVTIWATITGTTPATLAAIINDSETPEAATSPPVSDLPQHPGAPPTLHDHGQARRTPAGCDHLPGPALPARLPGLVAGRRAGNPVSDPPGYPVPSSACLQQIGDASAAGSPHSPRPTPRRPAHIDQHIDARLAHARLPKAA
jgi:site-specific DNA recombinase